MITSVTWKGVGLVGAVALIAGIVCLAIGANDNASALFVAGIAEVVVGSVLLLMRALKLKNDFKTPADR